MSRTVLRREGRDTVHLEHKHYGRFKFSTRSSLADAACSAEVFAGERTDGYAKAPACRRMRTAWADRLAPTATGSCRGAWR
jgi:hypothetical protein